MDIKPKSYKAVSDLLAGLRSVGYDAATLDAVRDGLAVMFKRDNPLFSRRDFVEACTPTGGTDRCDGAAELRMLGTELGIPGMAVWATSHDED